MSDLADDVGGGTYVVGGSVSDLTEQSPLGHRRDPVPPCPGRTFHTYEQWGDTEGEARCIVCGIRWYWDSQGVLRVEEA